MRHRSLGRARKKGERKHPGSRAGGCRGTQAGATWQVWRARGQAVAGMLQAAGRGASTLWHYASQAAALGGRWGLAAHLAQHLADARRLLGEQEGGKHDSTLRGGGDCKQESMEEKSGGEGPGEGAAAASPPGAALQPPPRPPAPPVSAPLQAQSQFCRPLLCLGPGT